MKNIFKKIKAYIQDTAWIQPILIVIIIFILLFLLNPIATAVKSGWLKMTTKTDMETITFDQYTKLVSEQTEDTNYIFVFSYEDKKLDDDSVTPKFYKSMNTFLKSAAYTSQDAEKTPYKIYNVNIKTKSLKVKINGHKYIAFKDSTLGVIASSNNSTANVKELMDKDPLKELDDRIDSFRETIKTSIVSESGEGLGEYYCNFSESPLIIWYVEGHETRVSNDFTGQVTLKSNGKSATETSFNSYITSFYDTEYDSADLETWISEHEFDLVSAK